MQKKNADLTVYNQVNSSLGRSDAEQVLLFADGSEEKLAMAAKVIQAVKILKTL